jgi:hypothetical protein
MVKTNVAANSDDSFRVMRRSATNRLFQLSTGKRRKYTSPRPIARSSA